MAAHLETDARPVCWPCLQASASSIAASETTDTNQRRAAQQPGERSFKHATPETERTGEPPFFLSSHCLFPQSPEKITQRIGTTCDSEAAARQRRFHEHTERAALANGSKIPC